MNVPLFVPMKSSGPAGGALVALGLLAIFAAAIYMQRQKAAAPASKQSNQYTYQP